MGYTVDGLKDKILEMYPEIVKHGIDFGLVFNKAQKAYVLKLKKGRHELTTYLEKKEADECLAGIKCISLGVQVGQFIKNFEEGEK